MTPPSVVPNNSSVYKENTLPIDIDNNAKFAEYADPRALVSSEWLAKNLGLESLVVLESDEDVLLYQTGHIPTARKIDWHTDLNDSQTRDYIDGEGFAAVMSRLGIKREDTIVLYGDKSNWWAAYALWVFKLFGHEDVRLLDGGRDKWISEGRELTKDSAAVSPTTYPVIQRNDSSLRAFRDDVFSHFGKPMIDVRSPEEYAGERLTAPGYPDEGASRAGHIPTAASVPWSKACNEDQSFKDRAGLEEVYLKGASLAGHSDVIAYCRIGERSSHTWFVLKYLLGIEKVRNYDGSWSEWGSLVKAPIALGAEPGPIPALV
jgi:thiosulfate/3-mercaptopyruvate sulfurtransferase